MLQGVAVHLRITVSVFTFCAPLMIVESIDAVARDTSGYEWSTAHPFLAGERQGPSDIQIGDLALHIPAGQAFTIEDIGKYTDFDYNKVHRFERFQQAFSLGFIAQDAWKMTGTHFEAHSWERTDLLIDIRVNAVPAARSSWCNLLANNSPSHNSQIPDVGRKSDEFYVLGEDRIIDVNGDKFTEGHRIPIRDVTLLGHSLVFDTSNRPQYDMINYSTFIRITNNVVMTLRFETADLRGIVFSKMIGNLETNLGKMLSLNPGFSVAPYKRQDEKCSQSQ